MPRRQTLENQTKRRRSKSARSRETSEQRSIRLANCRERMRKRRASTRKETSKCDAHMLIDKGEKPHACQFCGKRFRRKGNLRHHKAVHSTNNLFHCSLCNRGFKRRYVFIRHLRHRHNVSTETLDRRKYPTKPKHYQSIMDTLPPFVHADSAAIVTSEKIFDALVFESIKSHSEEDTHEIKPLITNNINETKANCIFSDAPSTPSANLNIVDPSSSVHSNNVTTSEDLDDEDLFCASCQCSFDREADFKHHLQIHIQHIVCKEEDSSACRSSTDAQKSSENSILGTESSPFTISTNSETNFAIKTEISSPEIDSIQMSEKPLVVSRSKSSQKLSEIFYPICKLSFLGEDSSKNHSQTHEFTLSSS